MTVNQSRRYASVVTAPILLACALAIYFLWPTPTLAPPGIETLGTSVERGKYLATVGNCKTCHTVDGGPAFAGGVRFQSDFGVLYSTNITQDKDYGIGNWSLGDFHRSMKHGVRPDGTHLYPAFPYTSFAKMTDADIASIFLYIKTIAPAKVQAKKNDLNFPYNFRFGLRAWNKLFHSSQTYADDPAQSVEWNRGAYLVQGPAHCGACHTPRNFLGAERTEQAMSGGMVYDEVVSGKYRLWSAVNLTPSETGLGAWNADDIVSYLKQGECGRAVVHGPMTEVVVNSTVHLDDADARAIATYLKRMPAAPERSIRAPSREQLKAGEIVYTVHCGTCHLPTGLGDEIMGVTLAGNAIVQSQDPASLINVVLYAPHLPPPPFVSDRTRMKPFGKRLSDDDIANLTTYVRNSFGNQAGSVSPHQVKRQR